MSRVSVHRISVSDESIFISVIISLEIRQSG